MKALIFRQHGGPEQLEYTDMPEPVVGPDEVLVQVKAVALNHLDLLVRRGDIPGLHLTLPHIGGSDFAGEVAAVGDAVTDLWVGSRVVVNPSLITDHGSTFPNISIIGEHTPGGFAEYALAPVENLMPLPPDFSFVDAAACPVVFQTAWRALMTRAKLRAGERILIFGASGGVSSAAIQIARLCGAYVYTTADTTEKMERAREIGADEVFNDVDEDVVSAVLKRTDRRGVDVVFESIGAETWEASMRMLARGGRLVTVGATSGEMAQTNLTTLFWKQLNLIGSTAATHAEFREVMSLIFDRRLTPIIDRVVPLSEGQDAQRFLETGKHFGKIVLEV
jgi:NADPH:quinone reductase-like Zn-dependent oxidoreductase